MTPIPLFEMNMDTSRNIYERESKNRLIATAQKIAIYTIIPFMMILSFEAVVKNLILVNMGNVIISLINGISEKYHCYV